MNLTLHARITVYPKIVKHICSVQGAADGDIMETKINEFKKNVRCSIRGK